MELDSHADAAACGSNCVIIHYAGQECDASPCTDAYESIKSVPIVQAATACDNPETGESAGQFYMLRGELECVVFSTPRRVSHKQTTNIFDR
jgi:hypothetical protein